jgi:transposase
MNTLTEVYVGVDVAKDALVTFVRPTMDQIEVKNTANGIKKLLKALSKHNVKRVVCEASGGYEAEMLSMLGKAGYEAYQVDPKRIKGFKTSLGRYAKTDLQDAQAIALFAEKMQPRHEKKHFSEEELSLKSLVKRRADLVAAAAEEKTRLKHPLQKKCADSIERHIAFINDEIKVKDKEIQALIEASNSWKRQSELLTSMPGIGKITAATIIVEMPELGSVSRGEAAALVGVAPYARQSGSYVGKTITMGGRFYLRKALYMAALTASRSNPVLAKFYQRLRKVGKAPKSAIVAVIRKMIIMLNVMKRENMLWKHV